MNVAIMTTPCGFKIRSKADVDKFMHECMGYGEYCIKINNELLFWITKGKDGSISVAEKIGDLYDIFNPLLEIANTKNKAYKISVRDYLWKNRKYINAKWFND